METEIVVDGQTFTIVWWGSRPSPWGGFTKGELMPPYNSR